jgi:hypothetical protein
MLRGRQFEEASLLCSRFEGLPGGSFGDGVFKTYQSLNVKRYIFTKKIVLGCSLFETTQVIGGYYWLSGEMGG